MKSNLVVLAISALVLAACSGGVVQEGDGGATEGGAFQDSATRDAATPDAGGARCTPGSYVFCRCPDRSEGTKRCSDDGQSFEPCSSGGGTCPGG
jgi:hypothetical protein